MSITRFSELPLALPDDDGFLVPGTAQRGCHYTAKSITKNIEPILKTIKDFVFKEYFLARTASPRKYWMMTKYNGRMSKHAMSATELFFLLLSIV